MAERPVFLAPHYDDVALSCGGTVASLADAGRAPLIVTIFAARPGGAGGAFSRWQHARWGLSVDPIAVRRQEDAHAARVMGAEVLWLDFLDAIYRGERYTSDAQLFGPVAADEAGLAETIWQALRAAWQGRAIAASTLYVPLGVGGHVDHRLTRQVGERACREGIPVLAYEDYPYAGDPGREGEAFRLAQALGGPPPVLQPLSDGDLARRVTAIYCYPSQLPVIFRHQGEPRAATARWARQVGGGGPAERFWPLPAGRA